MIKKLLKKLNSVSMKSGRFFADKSYKYDTIFFGAKFILELDDGSHQIDLNTKQTELINKFVEAFTLDPNSTDANRNYVLESFAFFEYVGAIKKIGQKLYQITDVEMLEYATVSIENAYILQYLTAYKTFLNDDIWDKYVEYVNDHNLSTKSDKLVKLADTIKECAHSVGENQDTPWANNFVKFQICVLALANEDNYISRTLNISDSAITPQQLSANVEGTRSTSAKNNFYIHDFRMSYVLNTLRPYLANVKKDAFLPSFPKRTYKDYPLNFILYGAPGTGKTFSTVEYAVSILEKKPLITIQSQYHGREGIKNAYDKYLKNGRVVFTTFHQNYSYEDFIEGLRPDSNSNRFKFKAMPGVFKRIVASALEDKNNNYVLIIDEINRANISRVLGELITLLEDDKRWGEENQMMVVLPTSKDVFVVPNNLFIIGTMNTADKSISMIDVALRRRFSFIETLVDLSSINDVALRNVLEKINERLKKDFDDGTDLLVGHAYFINKTENDLDLIMNQSVIPLLYEYYFDKTSKVKALVENSINGTDFEIDGSATGRIRIKKK